MIQPDTFLRAFGGDNFIPFYNLQWSENNSPDASDVNTALASSLTHTMREFTQLNTVCFCLCVHSRQFTVNTAMQGAHAAVTLAVHQRTVLCPH